MVWPARKVYGVKVTALLDRQHRLQGKGCLHVLRNADVAIPDHAASLPTSSEELWQFRDFARDHHSNAL
jgi:hypothetical protein